MRSTSSVADRGPAVAAFEALERAISSSNPQKTDPRSQLGDEALAAASRNAFPVVAQRKARRDNLGLIAGAAMALILGSVTFMSLSSNRAPKRPVEAAPAVTTVPQQTPHPSFAPVALPTGASALPQPDAASVAPQFGVGPIPQPMNMGAPRNASPVLVFEGGSPPAEQKSAEVAAGGATPDMLSGGSAGEGAAGLDSNAARSTRMTDPSSTIVQGTLIPAILETAINTDLPGYARAVVTEDVRSFDGRRVLVPRSSRLIGEYKGAIASGQKRAYLVWSRLVLPDGASIALGSPAVDFSGETGVGGRVDSHFFQRFGSAILLSVLGGAGALVSGGSTVVVSGGTSAASVAAQRDSDRAPTIHVRPGEPIRVFTARDLIFSPSGR